MSFRMMKTVYAVAAVSMGASAMPAAAVEQVSEVAVVAVVAPKPEPDRAAELRAAAEQYISSPRQWSRAARLLERSVEFRAPDDAETYASLIVAGNLRAATGAYNTAQANFEKAASQAVSRGAVLDAAHAYINAAHAAVKGGNGQQAGGLVEAARLLSSSPMLTEAQKSQITRRLDAGE
jgi:hypothetical protein